MHFAPFYLGPGGGKKHKIGRDQMPGGLWATELLFTASVMLGEWNIHTYPGFCSLGPVL